MTDDDKGYHLGPEARVVLHRHGARRAYAVAVVVDEGPYASVRDAAAAAELIRERHSGWVSKATAAQRLGITERMVDYLRSSGQLVYEHDGTGHVLIDVKSLNAEIERRQLDE